MTTATTSAIDTLRQVADLFPKHADRLDDWQRSFITDQLARLEKWGDEIRLSEKQGVALQKALAAMQKAVGDEQ